MAQSDQELLALKGQIEQLRQAGKYPEALAIAQRAAALTEQRFGPNHLTLAAALNAVALLYEDQGRYQEAEPVYKRLIPIVEKSLGSEHRNLGVTLGNLAGVYQKQGRLGEALPLATRALAIAEKADGPERPSVAISLNNLASLNEARGRYAEAEPLYKRSLAIREKRRLGRSIVRSASPSTTWDYCMRSLAASLKPSHYTYARWRLLKRH